MHISSLRTFRISLRKYVYEDRYIMSQPKPRVLEVGSSDINGGARNLFPSSRFDWTGVDIASGVNVDIVVDEGSKLPFSDKQFDIVYSLQTFEHAPRFWILFSEMRRVCKHFGVLIVIAPSNGAEHRFPVDCYRFLPDSFRELARNNDLNVTELRQDEAGPFNDLLGVFHHKGFEVREKVKIAETDYASLNTWFLPFSEACNDPEVECGGGEIPYLSFLERVHEELAPRRYAEIGVWQGSSLELCKCPSLAIDPFPMLASKLIDRVDLYTGSSDQFFLEEDRFQRLDNLDFAYIDGLHHIEFALKDFMNLERHSSRCTVIAVDDIYPKHPIQAKRIRESSYWTGDVWKIIRILKNFRPDLCLLPIDTFPSGTLLIIGCDSANNSLWKIYDFLVSYEAQDCDPPPDILLRSMALSPRDPLLSEIFQRIRNSRGKPDQIDEIRSLVNNSMPRIIARGF